MGTITDVKLTPLKIIPSQEGSIMHAMKRTDDTFSGFGEAYFSTVNFNIVKGWKKHNQMILNLVVPQGAILFVLYDGREQSDTSGQIMEIAISKDNYQRLTVPPGVWMAFKGITEGVNMLLNMASIPHDPTEANNLPIQNDLINYNFSK